MKSTVRSSCKYWKNLEGKTTRIELERILWYKNWFPWSLPKTKMASCCEINWLTCGFHCMVIWSGYTTEYLILLIDTWFILYFERKRWKKYRNFFGWVEIRLNNFFKFNSVFFILFQDLGVRNWILFLMQCNNEQFFFFFFYDVLIFKLPFCFCQAIFPMNTFYLFMICTWFIYKKNLLLHSQNSEQ